MKEFLKGAEFSLTVLFWSLVILVASCMSARAEPPYEEAKAEAARFCESPVGIIISMKWGYGWPAERTLADFESWLANSADTSYGYPSKPWYADLVRRLIAMAYTSAADPGTWSAEAMDHCMQTVGTDVVLPKQEAPHSALPLLRVVDRIQMMPAAEQCTYRAQLAYIIAKADREKANFVFGTEPDPAELAWLEEVRLETEQLVTRLTPEQIAIKVGEDCLQAYGRKQVKSSHMLPGHELTGSARPSMPAAPLMYYPEEESPDACMTMANSAGPEIAYYRWGTSITKQQLDDTPFAGPRPQWWKDKYNLWVAQAYAWPGEARAWLEYIKAECAAKKEI